MLFSDLLENNKTQNFNQNQINQDTRISGLIFSRNFIVSYNETILRKNKQHWGTHSCISVKVSVFIYVNTKIWHNKDKPWILRVTYTN